VTDFKLAFKTDCQFASTALIRHGELAPMFVVHSRDGRMVPVLVAIERDAAYTVARLVCIAYDAIAISMIAEAWTATEQKDRPPSVVPIREREDRMEVVSVAMVASEPERCQFTSLREIIRDWNGKITGVGPELIPEDAQGEGTLFELLPPHPPSKMERQAAQVLLDQATKRGLLS
jgi:hypothetical protein